MRIAMWFSGVNKIQNPFSSDIWRYPLIVIWRQTMNNMEECQRSHFAHSNCIIALYHTCFTLLYFPRAIKYLYYIAAYFSTFEQNCFKLFANSFLFESTCSRKLYWNVWKGCWNVEMLQKYGLFHFVYYFSEYTFLLIYFFLKEGRECIRKKEWEFRSKAIVTIGESV